MQADVGGSNTNTPSTPPHPPTGQPTSPQPPARDRSFRAVLTPRSDPGRFMRRLERDVTAAGGDARALLAGWTVAEVRGTANGGALRLAYQMPSGRRLFRRSKALRRLGLTAPVSNSSSPWGGSREAASPALGTEGLAQRDSRRERSDDGGCSNQHASASDGTEEEAEPQHFGEQRCETTFLQVSVAAPPSGRGPCLPWSL